MERALFINKKKIGNEYSSLGSGSEGIVYKYDDKTAIKIFKVPINPQNSKRMKIKLQKIRILSKIKDPSFCFPLGFVNTSLFNRAGYYMESVVVDGEIKTFSDIHFLKSQREILECIIKASDAIKRMHARGIILGDIKENNILLNRDNEPKFIDTDNYLVDGIGFDIAPFRRTWLHVLYGKSFSQEDNDKYLFAYIALKYFNESSLIYLKQNAEVYMNFIDLLDIPNSAKEGLRLILSDAPDKPYIGDVLREIDQDKHPISKENIEKIKEL